MSTNVMFVSSVRLHSCHIVGPNNIKRDLLNAIVYIKFIDNVDKITHAPV